MFQGLPLPANVAAFVVAAAVVWLAGGRIVRVADAIAERTGIGRAVIGMLVLGGVTSLPELAIAVTAGIAQTPELTVNDVLGSASANLVILAVADAFVRGRPLSSSHHAAPLMLQAALGIVLLALPVAAAVTGDRNLLGIGAWSWVMLVVYLAALRLISRSRSANAWQVQDGSKEERADDNADVELSRARLTVMGAIAAGAVLVAGFVLARAGEALAEQTGLGTSFFAVVFLAIATSMPEVSTVIAAVRRRRYEMAISDVLGTNLFNIIIVVLADALDRGEPVLVVVGASATIGALMALLLTATFLVGMIERRDRTVLGVGIDSIVIVLTYIAGLTILYHLR